MKFRVIICIILLLLFSKVGYAQYFFSGYVEENNVNGTAYLSLISDYRRTIGVYEEQVISKMRITDNYIEFRGDNLDIEHKLYKIHIDNCNNGQAGKSHFNGKCDATSQIVFIANNNDSIGFPSSFEDQMFCSIDARKKHAKAIFKIDSLKELMTFDYISFRSEANRNLNNKKWFTTLQNFGKELDEPLAELYVYNFLSDRSSDFHTYYLNDVQSNTYYDQLLGRLVKSYPNSTYTKQYEAELATDRYALEYVEGNYIFSWKYILFALLLLSVLLNFFFWSKLNRSNRLQQKDLKGQLTKQEQRILELILQNKTNKEIAQEIFVSVSTVKTHINNLYKKLNIASRDEIKVLFSN